MSFKLCCPPFLAFAMDPLAMSILVFFDAFHKMRENWYTMTVSCADSSRVDPKFIDDMAAIGDDEEDIDEFDADGSGEIIGEVMTGEPVWGDTSKKMEEGVEEEEQRSG